MRNGFFDDDADVIDEINRSGAAFLIVCLGVPKQEKWIAAHKRELRVKLTGGFGGSVDIFAGTAKRAPKIFIKLRLEWFYRLSREPERIGRMMKLPKFVFRHDSRAPARRATSPQSNILQQSHIEPFGAYLCRGTCGYVAGTTKTASRCRNLPRLCPFGLAGNLQKILTKTQHYAILRLQLFAEVNDMKYVCTICGYVYDEEKGEPDSGIQPGTKWDDVSEDFVCPVCGAPKDAFEKSDE